ncbi:hypothetical protein FRC15_004377 [Serendipita sp. 397]|nr:hypothetical protein FRC15_004377 [Serendipita sp. 397]
MPHHQSKRSQPVPAPARPKSSTKTNGPSSWTQKHKNGPHGSPESLPSAFPGSGTSHRTPLHCDAPSRSSTFRNPCTGVLDVVADRLRLTASRRASVLRRLNSPNPANLHPLQLLVRQPERYEAEEAPSALVDARPPTSHTSTSVPHSSPILVRAPTPNLLPLRHSDSTQLPRLGLRHPSTYLATPHPPQPSTLTYPVSIFGSES